MTYYYDEVLRSRRHAFAAGVVAGALVIALIWVSLWAVGSSGLEEPAPAAPTGEAQGTPPLISETAQNRLTRCEEVFAAQTPVLETLAGPLSQWRNQISRTNKLVTGVITLDEGLNVWDQTRVGVIDELAQYRSARDAFDERTARCPGPNEGNPRSFEVQCSKGTALREAQIRAADTALGSWKLHVDDLELLRAGQITYAEVSQRWLTTWRQDVKELKTYSRAARAAEGQVC